eukprot:g30830.t1
MLVCQILTQKTSSSGTKRELSLNPLIHERFTKDPQTAPSKPMTHPEGQGQQIHGNTTTYKLSSKPLTILTWKYIAVPSVSLGQNPG